MSCSDGRANRERDLLSRLSVRKVDPTELGLVLLRFFGTCRDDGVDAIEYSWHGVAEPALTVKYGDDDAIQDVQPSAELSDSSISDLESRIERE